MPRYAERVRAPSAKESAARPAPARPPARRLSPSQQAALSRALQLRAGERAAAAPSPEAPSRGGLPERLKAGVEALSGLAMDDVRVHRDSPEPARLGALAYTQGSDIHLGPGQEQHLPHEAWHVVQQKQGRVRPTAQLKGDVPVNDDATLEREADAMGARALAGGAPTTGAAEGRTSNPVPPVQAKAEMKARGTQKGNLKSVRRKLVMARDARGNAWATVEEIGWHDRAQNAGQHHADRNVRLNQLIGDIDATLTGLTDLNLRDSDLLGAESKAGRGAGNVATQLRRGAAAAPVRAAPVVQLYANYAEVQDAKHKPTANFAEEAKLAIANWCQANNTNSLRGVYAQDYQHNYAETANNINYAFAFDWNLAIHIDFGGPAHNGVDTPHLQAVRALHGLDGTTQAAVNTTKGAAAAVALDPPLAYTDIKHNAVALTAQQSQACMDANSLDGAKDLIRPKLKAFGEDWARSHADKDSGAKDARAAEEPDLSGIDLFG